MAQITSQKCDLCIENEAALFCYECKDALCVTCRKMHDRMRLTKNHTVAGLDKVDRLVYQCKALCETHREVLSFNCIACSCLICNSCLTSDHKDHSICSIVELSAKTRATVKENVAIMKTTCQEITDVLEKVKHVHNQKVLNPTRQEISEIQNIGTFLRGVVDDIEITRTSEVEAFKEFESDHLGTAIKRLEALHKEYIASCNIFERMLEETHEITFLQMYNMHKRSFTQLDDIPMVCEPDERKAFEPESFFYDMMSRVNTVERFSESVKAVARKIVQNELDENKTTIHDLNLEISRYKSDIDDKNQQLNEKSTKIKELLSQIAKLGSNIDDKTKQLDKNKTTIHDLNLEISMFKSNIKDKNQQLNEKSTEIKDLQSQISKMRSNIDDTTKQICSLVEFSLASNSPIVLKLDQPNCIIDFERFQPVVGGADSSFCPQQLSYSCTGCISTMKKTHFSLRIQDGSYNQCLNEKSTEIKDLQSQISKLRSNIDVTTKQIYRVQNPMLYIQYAAKRKELWNLNKKNPEKWLWYGTSADTVNKVIHSGFNRSNCGNSGTAYRNGMYFFVNAGYSIGSCGSGDNHGYMHMFSAQVLTGDTVSGSRGMVLLPLKPGYNLIAYDSACDNPSNPVLFIIFHDSQAYPTYHILFK